MIVYFHKVNKPYIMVIDVEHDQGKLLEFAAVLFKRVGKYLYQICKSVNFYVKQKRLTPFIKDYICIDENFLDEYGVEMEEARDMFEEFVERIPSDDLMVVSHGIHQDDLVLFNNGINIGIYEHWCTYNMSKWVLERYNNLTLEEVSREFGYTILSKHNAYADVWATVAVYSGLLKIEEEEE